MIWTSRKNKFRNSKSWNITKGLYGKFLEKEFQLEFFLNSLKLRRIRQINRIETKEI